jgi:acyl carrier protein
LMLILAVEEAFGIEFGEAELVNLTSFPALLAAVETRAGR